MPRRAITFETVRKMGLSLDGVEESTSYGTPSLKVHGRLMTCMAINKSVEPQTLVVSIGFDDRNELIAADPETYYLKDHYVDYPSVLVRLSRVHPDALRDLLRGSWEFVRAQKPLKRKRSRR